MKKITSLLMMALLTVGMGLTSCDEQLDNAVTPYTPGVTPEVDEKGEVTSITVDLSKIDAKYLDTEKRELVLTVGDVVTLSFTILPEEMADTEVELTVDDANILSVEGLKVTAKKAGETKVTAKAGDKTAECTVTVSQAVVDLSTITTGNYTVEDGTVLTGALAADATTNIKIADGATVTLKNVTINGTNVDDEAYKHAGITSGDNSTIVLEGENTVNGFYENYPGIHVPEGKTLTIMGSGKLTASSNGFGAGIGGVFKIPCGNIVIKGGTITATGGTQAAGIGGGGNGTCGNITISGGTVEATGGPNGAGIGSGNVGTCGAITISGGTVEAKGGESAAGIGGGLANLTCGTITITSGVTSVKATKGYSAPNSIGAGRNGTAITVTKEDPTKVTEN